MDPTYATVNLRNLIHNYYSIRSKTKSKVMAVVKADAYGHGMIECVQALSKIKNKPEYYGVALEKEALELRNSLGINEPILCFGPFQKKYIDLYLRSKIIPTLTSISQIKDLYKLKYKGKLKVHLNINTGMNRLGIKHDQAFNEIVRLNHSKKIIIDGIYTHFATSDETDKTFAEKQLYRFSSLVKKLKAHKVNYGLAHTANSGAICDMPNTYFDMVRPGISLYGYYPSNETSESLDLKPVMSLYSKLSSVFLISKGESVGYGRLFTAKKRILCGSIPIGYADGLSRALSNKINVIIGDRIFKQIGRISMDRINIDLGEYRPKINSKVILIGSTRNFKIDAWDWASKVDTIPYEITCNISKRVARNYIRKV